MTNGRTLMVATVAAGLVFGVAGVAQAAPGSPKSVSASAGVNTIAVVWDAPDAGKPTGYEIVCLDQTGSSRVINTASATARAYEVKSLVAGLSYTCSVAAKDAAGTSAASSAQAVTVLGVPVAPQLLGLAAGDGVLSLTFQAPSNTGGSPVVDYWATCGSTTITGTASPISVPLPNSTSSVSCSVKARNAIGLSPASNSMAATPGQRPKSARVTRVSIPATGSLLVSASATTPSSTPVTSWTALCTGTAGDQLTGTSPSSPITVTGTSNGFYTCVVVATNAYGASAPSLPSTPIRAVPVLAPPGTPTVTWKRTTAGAAATVAFARYDGARAYTVICKGAGKTVSDDVQETTAVLALVPAEWKCSVKADVGGFDSPESAVATATINPAAPKVTGAKGELTVARPAGLTKWTATCTPSKGKAVSKTGSTTTLKLSKLAAGSYSCVAAGNGVQSDATAGKVS